MRRIAIETAQAWALKETAMDFWRYRTPGWTRNALLKWHSWVI